MTDKEPCAPKAWASACCGDREEQLELADADKDTLSRREAIERLKADLKSLEEGTRRLEGASQERPDRYSRRRFQATGDRQYLTGLRVGGERILLLVDASASMLDDTVVNVLRMRNMSDARKLLSEKWRRTSSTVDWLAAQIPEKGRVPDLCLQHEAWPL